MYLTLKKSNFVRKNGNFRTQNFAPLPPNFFFMNQQRKIIHDKNVFTPHLYLSKSIFKKFKKFLQEDDEITRR